jgi:hypothetical protein
LFEEAVQGRGGDRRFVFAGRQRQLAQQRGAGAVRIFALEAFDQIGELRGDGARLSPVLPGLRRQGFEAAVAVTERPFQQRIHGDRGAFGMRDLVVAARDLLGAPREFAAGQRFQHERRDQSIAEQGDFFGFGIHEEDLLSQKHKAEGVAGSMQKLCGGTQAGGAAGRSAAQRPSGARNAGQPNR